MTELASAKGHAWKHCGGVMEAYRCTECGGFLSGHVERDDYQPCPGKVTINVRLDGDYSLNVGDIWPDGDWPDEINAAAVAGLMSEHFRELIVDWGLSPTFLVSVGSGAEVEVGR